MKVYLTKEQLFKLIRQHGLDAYNFPNQISGKDPDEEMWNSAVKLNKKDKKS